MLFDENIGRWAENASKKTFYEEYHPYGTSAYRAFQSSEVSARRYRYTGKERDEETSLYYYGARYYAPWLGRWTAADPAGLVDGPGLFNYCRGSPVTLRDPNGTESNQPQIVLEFGPIEFKPDKPAKPQPSYEKLEQVVGPEGAKEFRAGYTPGPTKKAQQKAEVARAEARELARLRPPPEARPPDEGQQFTQGTLTREELQEARLQQLEAEYYAKHPSAAQQRAAELEFLSKAVDPAGAGLVKAGTFGLAVTVGFSPAEAAAKAAAVELVVQATAIGTRAVPRLPGATGGAGPAAEGISPPESHVAAPPTAARVPLTEPPTTTMLADVTVRSHGRVVGRGNVYLGGTIEGIRSGRIPPRDIFQNREGRLPPKGPGYYREHVHPTPGARGAGAQRIVQGRAGELYYTPDHYRTFIRLR